MFLLKYKFIINFVSEIRRRNENETNEKETYKKNTSR